MLKVAFHTNLYHLLSRKSAANELMPPFNDSPKTYAPLNAPIQLIPPTKQPTNITGCPTPCDDNLERCMLPFSCHPTSNQPANQPHTLPDALLPQETELHSCFHSLVCCFLYLCEYENAKRKRKLCAVLFFCCTCVMFSASTIQ